MLFRQLLDPDTSTYTYLLADEETKEAALIDPVADHVDRDLALLDELGLQLRYSLETHVHADHITGGGTLREKTGAMTVLSKRANVQCADISVEDGSTLELGNHRIEVIETPGHTDGCVSYVADGRVFTGDALLIRGCGRTDFQQGDSKKLYDSVVNKLFRLPKETVIYPGHDYKGRTCSSIAEEIEHNPRLGGGRTQAQFEEIMRNLQLAPPKKIKESVPANLSCGTRSAPVDINGEVDAGWVRRTAQSVGFRLVDVRSAEEFYGDLGHIEGSELVPIDTLDHAAVSWEKSAPIVTICRSGNRSRRAQVLLQAMGFSRVLNMKGGLMSLAEAVQ